MPPPRSVRGNRPALHGVKRELLTQTELRNMGPVRELPPVGGDPAPVAAAAAAAAPAPATAEQHRARQQLAELGALPSGAPASANRPPSSQFRSHLERRARAFQRLQEARVVGAGGAALGADGLLGTTSSHLVDDEEDVTRLANNFNDLFSNLEVDNFGSKKAVGAAVAALTGLKSMESLLGAHITVDVHIGATLLQHFATPPRDPRDSRVRVRDGSESEAAPRSPPVPLAQEGGGVAPTAQTAAADLRFIRGPPANFATCHALSSDESPLPLSALPAPFSPRQSQRNTVFGAHFLDGCDLPRSVGAGLVQAGRRLLESGGGWRLGSVVIPSSATVHQALGIIFARLLLVRSSVGLTTPTGALVAEDSPFAAVAAHPLCALLCCAKLIMSNPNGEAVQALHRLLPASSSWAQPSTPAQDEADAQYVIEALAAGADREGPSPAGGRKKGASKKQKITAMPDTATAPAASVAVAAGAPSCPDEADAALRHLVSCCSQTLRRSPMFCEKRPEKGDGAAAAEEDHRAPQMLSRSGTHHHRSAVHQRLVVRNTAAPSAAPGSPPPAAGVAISSRPLLKILLKKSLNDFQTQAEEREQASGGATSVTEAEVMAAIGPPFHLRVEIAPKWAAAFELQRLEADHRWLLEGAWDGAAVALGGYAYHFLTREPVLREGLEGIEAAERAGLRRVEFLARQAAARAEFDRYERDARATCFEAPYRVLCFQLWPMCLERLQLLGCAVAAAASIAAEEKRAFDAFFHSAPSPYSATQYSHFVRFAASHAAFAVWLASGPARLEREGVDTLRREFHASSLQWMTAAQHQPH